VPEEERSNWELIAGVPQRPLRALQESEIVATTPEDLLRYLDGAAQS
jgi:hypothetical protein